MIQSALANQCGQKAPDNALKNLRSNQQLRPTGRHRLLNKFKLSTALFSTQSGESFFIKVTNSFVFLQIRRGDSMILTLQNTKGRFNDFDTSTAQ